MAEIWELWEGDPSSATFKVTRFGERSWAEEERKHSTAKIRYIKRYNREDKIYREPE